MNPTNEIVDKVIKAAYVLTALICFNMLAFVYDAQWVQAAIVIDSAIILSFTGITLSRFVTTNLRVK